MRTFRLLLLSIVLTLPALAENYWELPSVALNERQVCDLELLFNGGFAPLNGFMEKASYDRVVNEMRLADGTVWPIPITLDIDDQVKTEAEAAGQLVLRTQTGTILALLKVKEIWSPDKQQEAQKVYGTLNKEHPGVEYLLNQTAPWYISGELIKVADPVYHDFTSLRKTPEQLKALFKEKGWEKIVAFQTRNPMHRAHFELTRRAAQQVDGHLLLHPVVGLTKPGDVDHFTRVKCYQKLLPLYPEGFAQLSLLPIAMRMAGPREAVWHAIIRKNYGCTHFIVGRDHAGPGKDSQGRDFYPPYAAQELAVQYAKEIGIEILPFKEMVYVKEDQSYQPVDEVEEGKTILAISGTELRRLLRGGGEIPEWFSYPELIEELRKIYPPKEQQGVTLFFTGLSGAGKSSILEAVASKLMERQHRNVTVLDADIVRNLISKGLGFSKQDRSLNVQRVGFIASEIMKHRGLVLCALIAPYEEDRAKNRRMIQTHGNYIEIYVNTPVSECEKRDPKGLYAKYRSGALKGLSGMDDPYEPPLHPEIEIDTSKFSIEEAGELIMEYLAAHGFISP